MAVSIWSSETDCTPDALAILLRVSPRLTTYWPGAAAALADDFFAFTEGCGVCSAGATGIAGVGVLAALAAFDTEGATGMAGAGDGAAVCTGT
ncbi:hypothetical protein GALL_497230 [mine drainage metagenome]|uniref:Uncharacterized protein n=1 Tax=mine drainage metagenome TaxID=410659 RepID=A0A1J5PAM5_9ZZZZ